MTVVVVWVRHTTCSILLRDEPSEGFEWEFPELRDVFTMVVRKHSLKNCRTFFTLLSGSLASNISKEGTMSPATRSIRVR